MVHNKGNNLAFFVCQVVCDPPGLTCGSRSRNLGASKPSKSLGDRTQPGPHQP